MSATVASAETKKLTKADFVSDQTVRWCPGCGDYSILANVQKFMPELEMSRENIVFFSGIGCSSRFPYYMNTYGFHTIHGRAPAFATGFKIARPELSVWIVTGDGDGLSIGGNHLLHILRRNLDVNILLFNNRIYGLTKGQYSPTSEQGKVTKSTPLGSIDTPLNTLTFALAAEATFTARALDVDPKGMQQVLRAAAKHKGTSFIEIYQNCNIFNDGAFANISDRSVREERMLRLQHGEPLIFGKDQDKGIRLNGFTPEVVTLGNGVTEKDLIVHDQYSEDPMRAYLMSRMNFPEFPVPMGVLRSIERETYEEAVEAQVQSEIERKGPGDLEQLLCSGQVWEIGETVTSKGGPEQSEDEKMVIEERIARSKLGFQRDLMRDNILYLEPKHQTAILGPNDSIAHAIRCMQEENHGCVLVVENEKLVGIFTEGDVLVKIVDKEYDLENTPVSQHMTHNPFTIDAEDSVAIAFNLMAVKGFHHLPVLQDGKPIGWVSSRNLLAYISGHVKSGI